MSIDREIDTAKCMTGPLMGMVLAGATVCALHATGALVLSASVFSLILAWSIVVGTGAGYLIGLGIRRALGGGNSKGIW